MFFKDYDSWNRLKKAVDHCLSSTLIREGEIRWCKLGINVGNETLGKGVGFKRPVLILKKYSRDVFLAVPLTSRIHYGSWYYPVRCGDLVCSLILNQARTLDRKRLEEKMIELNSKELLKVKRAYCSLVLS